MQKLRVLAPLLVGLTFVFLAPTAQADCPHQGRFDHPHCDLPSKPAIVIDANDREVGQVMTSTKLIAHALRSDDGITYPLIVFRHALDGFFTVRFTTDNCTEPAYIVVNPGQAPSIWTLADLGPPGAFGPTVYVADPEAVSEDISLRSFWNVTIVADGTVIEGCDLDERDFTAKPADFLTELDLTPPFRVVLPD